MIQRLCTSFGLRFHHTKFPITISASQKHTNSCSCQQNFLPAFHFLLHSKSHSLVLSFGTILPSILDSVNKNIVSIHHPTPKSVISHSTSTAGSSFSQLYSFKNQRTSSSSRRILVVLLLYTLMVPKEKYVFRQWMSWAIISFVCP